MNNNFEDLIEQLNKTNDRDVEPIIDVGSIKIETLCQLALDCANIYAKYQSTMKYSVFFEKNEVLRFQKQAKQSFNAYMSACVNVGIPYSFAKNKYLCSYNDALVLKEYHPQRVLDESFFTELMRPFILNQIALKAAIYQVKSETAANHAYDGAAIGFFPEADLDKEEARKYDALYSLYYEEYLRASTSQAIAEEAFISALDGSTTLENDALTVSLDRRGFLEKLSAEQAKLNDTEVLSLPR
jgi:hypothetical protein